MSKEARERINFWMSIVRTVLSVLSFALAVYIFLNFGIGIQLP